MSLRNYRMREKNIIFVYGCFSLSCYIKGENHILRNNWIFRYTCCINNPHWQSGESLYNKYYTVISDTLVGSFLDVLFLLLAIISSGTHGNQGGIKIESQKKVHRRICVRGITFLTARPPSFLCHFVLVSSSTLCPLLSDVLDEWPL